MSYILRHSDSLKQSIVNMFNEYGIEPRSYGYQLINVNPIVIARSKGNTSYWFNKIRVAYKTNGWEVVELKCGNVVPQTIKDGPLVNDVEISIIY